MDSIIPVLPCSSHDPDAVEVDTTNMLGIPYRYWTSTMVLSRRTASGLEICFDSEDKRPSASASRHGVGYFKIVSLKI